MAILIGAGAATWAVSLESALWKALVGMGGCFLVGALAFFAVHALVPEESEWHERLGYGFISLGLASAVTLGSLVAYFALPHDWKGAVRIFGGLASFGGFAATLAAFAGALGLEEDRRALLRRVRLIEQEARGSGECPISLAMGRNDFWVARELIICGADVKMKGPFGMTPLHVLPGTSLPADEKAITGRGLITFGAEVDACDEGGYTPLLRAAEKGEVPLAEALLAAGANVNHQAAATGRTALHLAAGQGFKDMVLSLLNHGADTSLRNRDGQTPLEEAHEMNQEECARLILKGPERREARKRNQGRGNKKKRQR